MNILLTSIGKRIELINHLKTKARVIGVDCSTLNPAKEFVDSFYLIPKATDQKYPDALIDICKKEKVDYLIPLYEGEFPILNGFRDRLEEAGTRLLLSDAKIIDICKNKFSTAEFFSKYEIPAPITYSAEIERDLSRIEYPVVLKPLDGMGSEGVHIITDEEELLFYTKRTSGYIVQECLKGKEYTIDILCDNNGKIIYLVPRIRLEVRGGEVSKSRIDLNSVVEKLCRKVMECLNKEGYVVGPYTLQCFLTDDNTAKMLEINPRFGGGVPLSFASGANYVGALESMLKGEEIIPNPIEEMTMLRYDSSVFIK